MKKKSKILKISIWSIIFITVVVFVIVISGTKPFKDISTSDISSVTVKLLPPNQTYELNHNEIETLVEILQTIVIYNKDESYGEYDGQLVIYTLQMTDGSQLTVSAYNPFLIINDIGYRVKYEPCQKLNSFANKFLDK